MPRLLRALFVAAAFIVGGATVYVMHFPPPELEAAYTRTLDGRYLLGSAKMLVGDSGGLAQAVDLSGDVTVSNTGAVTIANGAVETAMLAVTETADGTIAARRLVAVDAAGDHLEAGSLATNVVGINAENAGKVDTNSMLTAYFGKVTGIAADDIDEGVPLKSCYGGKVCQLVDATLTGTTIDTWTAGGNFGNQPANDGIEAVSSEAADTMDLTLWFTRDSLGDTVYTETIALTGDTPVSLAVVDASLVLAAELSAGGAGTITIREASGDATITTIDSTAATTAGIVEVPDADQRAFAVAPTAVAGGASTKQIGLIGTNPSDGAATLLDSQALNGTTAVTMNSAFFRVTRLLVGDVATGTTGTVAVGAIEDRERRVGVSITAATAADQTVDFNLQP